MTPCTTCLTVDCIDVGDLTRYNFQLNAFISPQYTFVVSCPIGVVCQPGVYPVTITIPPGTFIIPLPDPNGPITGVGPLTVQCCTGQLTAAIPDGSTQAQIQALAAGLAQQAAQAQAGCNVLKSPGGSIPAPTPPVFSNNLQCVPTLTCTPPDMFTVTGSIPTGYQLAIDNALCILPGMVTSTSQADADAKALAQVTAEAAALIGDGTLACVAGLNFNDFTWPAPTVNLNGNIATWIFSNNHFSFDVTSNSSVVQIINNSNPIIYNGPLVNCNCRLVITVPINPLNNFPAGPIEIMQDGVDILYVDAKSYQIPGTYDIPFVVTDTGGMNSSIVVQQATISIGDVCNFSVTLTPAF